MRMPDKDSKCVNVDGWMIPTERVERYRAARELCAAIASMIFAPYCAEVKRQWAGSEDGEAVTGLDKAGQLICLVHLDPDMVQQMAAARKAHTLRQYLLETSGLAERIAD